jgi:hypothetical protein
MAALRVILPARAAASGEHAPDLRAVCPRRLDDACGAGIEDGGDAAGLCVERVAWGHGERFAPLLGDVSVRLRQRGLRRTTAGSRRP